MSILYNVRVNWSVMSLPMAKPQRDYEGGIEGWKDGLAEWWLGASFRSPPVGTFSDAYYKSLPQL